jgi:DNA-binding MarR family transcriptional regulator
VTTAVQDREEVRGDTQLLDLLERLEKTERPDERDFEALSLFVVEAILAHDDKTLRSATTPLRRLHGRRADAADIDKTREDGRFAMLLSVVSWTLDRLAPEILVQVEPDSQLFSFLRAVAHEPGIASSELEGCLELDKTAVSRLGRRARETQLAQKQRFGRLKRWYLTPRGRQALAIATAQELVPLEQDAQAPEVVAASDHAAEKLLAWLPETNRQPDELVEAAAKAAGDAIAESKGEIEISPEQLAPYVLVRAVLGLREFERTLLGGAARALGATMLPSALLPSDLAEAFGKPEPIQFVGVGEQVDVRDSGTVAFVGVSAAQPKRPRWVVQRGDDGWRVIKEGNSRASAKAATKADAVAEGRKLARKHHGQIVIESVDGRVLEERDYSSLGRVDALIRPAG